MNPRPTWFRSQANSISVSNFIPILGVSLEEPVAIVPPVYLFGKSPE
jgi:hypothetical protein